ncbi:MAG: sigma 54-interacting transcriptional regulator [Hyphomicrobiales bacterium]
MHWDTTAKYEFLLKVTNAVVTQTNREDMFAALARELKKSFAYDRLSIYIFMPDTEELVYFASATGVIPKNMADPSGRPLDKASIAREVITSRRPVYLEDLRQYRHFSTVPEMLKSGLKATMAFPLIVRKKILGTMHVSFKQKPAAFAELASVLNDLSRQVAIAVDNMWAHASLQELNRKLQEQNRFLQRQIKGDWVKKESFEFASRSMQQVMERVNLVAGTAASVLITGETGTGKGVLAEYIHDLSPVRDNLFVKVNCPALVSDLFESELFGHSRGAFTGAHTQRIGRFEMARGGTVFLDEITELPVSLQAKLLHVLQDRSFERVGDSRPIEANFRVISATNQDLQQAIEKGRFRRDLYYRLATVTIELPPLRERREDIPIIIERLSAVEEAHSNRPIPVFSPSALDYLCRGDWPGNIRELSNLLKTVFVLRAGKTISVGDVKHFLGEVSIKNPENLSALLASEKKIIEKALRESGGRVAGPRGASRKLGLPTSTLQYRLKKHAINPKDFLPA